MVQEGVNIAIALKACCDAPSKLFSVKLEPPVVGMSKLAVGVND